MPSPPALETGERFFLVLRPRDGDERLRRLPATGSVLLAARVSFSGGRTLSLGGRTLFGARTFPSGRRHARRLAGSLPVVRRPGRVAESRRFLRRGQLEQLVERPSGGIHAGRCVAALGETRRGG